LIENKTAIPIATDGRENGEYNKIKLNLLSLFFEIYTKLKKYRLFLN